MSSKKRGPTPAKQWDPFVQVTPVHRVTREVKDTEPGCEYWANNVFFVTKRVIPPTNPDGTRREGCNLVWLSLHRNDRKPIRDWRHMQRIKNELVGPECEGVEMYPAESRLVDTSNEYHLWCFDDPTFRFPFGYEEREVMDHDDPEVVTCGAVQRPLAAS